MSFGFAQASLFAFFVMIGAKTSSDFALTPVKRERRKAATKVGPSSALMKWKKISYSLQQGNPKHIKEERNT
jgi:hypothetical protein